MKKIESLPRMDQSIRSPIDMSPQAMEDRLRRCSALSVLCIKLKNAKKRPHPGNRAADNQAEV